jgi:hypothetical protein
MYEMAKKARAAMKAKAKSMSADPHQKVDSSDWSPPEPLNADVQTGMRPVSRRQFKSGGKVTGVHAKANMGKKPRKAAGGSAMPPVDRYINRDMKKANDYRDGVKHVGGMKRGGKTDCGGRSYKNTGGGKDVIGSMIQSMPADYDTDAMNQKMRDIDMDTRLRDKYGNIPTPPTRPSRLRKDTDISSPFKHGGRTHKADGGDTLRQLNAGVAPSQMGHKKGGRTHKDQGGSMNRIDAGVPSSMLNFTTSRSPAWQIAKKGGKIEHPDEAADKQLIRKMVKPEARTGKKHGGAKWIQGAIKHPGSLHKALHVPMGEKIPAKKLLKAEHSSNPKLAKKAHLAETLKHMHKEEGGSVFSGPSYPGKVPGATGGRTARKHGGKTGKMAVHVNINTKPDGMMNPMGGGIVPPPVNLPGLGGGRPLMPGQMGPAGAPPMGGMPMGGAPAGGPPMVGGAPPMPAGRPAGLMPTPRKDGGRLTKRAKSYMDMEAGSGSGEGRLQKSDIASRY